MEQNKNFTTFGQYSVFWLKTYKSFKSIRTRQLYEYALAKLESVNSMPLAEISTADLQHIININSAHPRTCQLLKLTLNQIFENAFPDENFNPSKRLELPRYKAREKRIISLHEIELIKACDFKEADKLYVSILMQTGLRPAEALALKWDDFDFERHMLFVSRALTFDKNVPLVKCTKTGTDRIVPLNDELVSILKTERAWHFGSLGLSGGGAAGAGCFTNSVAGCLEDSGTNGFENPGTARYEKFDTGCAGEWVFEKRGRLYSRQQYKSMKKRILALINEAFGGNESWDCLNGLNMYSFRHTYATFLYYTAVKTGMISAKQAARIMGHSERMFIDVYTHIDEDYEKTQALIHYSL